MTRAKAAPATRRPLPVEQLLDFQSRMLEIRLFEDEIQRLFTQDAVRGSTHLCSGQEAVSVGACAALQDGDSMLCTYRGHGAVLAMGAPLDRTFAEILGKAPGLCAGKGGSMHLTDVSVGAYGSFAIVGAHLPIAVGLAFASRYQGADEVSLCFFGDGTVNIGAFHEALNLSALWKLPVIWVCENNFYGEYSPLASTTPVHELVKRADSYGMRSSRVDGNDPTAVYEAVADARSSALNGEGPTMVEALTYRHKGHSRTDPATYRPQEEVAEWLARDPIVLLEAALRDQGVEASRLQGVRQAAEESVREALDRAMAWPDPDVDSRFEHVYA